MVNNQSKKEGEAMRDFLTQFEIYCKTPGVESGKPRSYAKAIPYFSGFWEDSTRLPEYYDGTYEYLKSLGIEEI